MRRTSVAGAQGDNMPLGGVIVIGHSAPIQLRSFLRWLNRPCQALGFS